MYPGYNSDLDRWNAECGNLMPPEPQTCTCDIMTLMSVGCKCGQFQREQTPAPKPDEQSSHDGVFTIG